MTIGLDLSASEAKLARAREHTEILEREAPADVAKDGAYAIRFSQVDPQTGWCEVFLIPSGTQKPRPSIIFGDAIHNLRCALDYIITTLADASGASITTRHQFPVFNTQPGYDSRVANKTDGPLQSITNGIELIRQLQPYHRKPDPRQDPLWHIHRFSNADKHRQSAALLAIPQSEKPIQIHFNGIPVETDPVLEIADWQPDKEYVIHRIRFDPPRAHNFRVEGPLELALGFSTPPFGTEPGHAMNLGQLRLCCNHVAAVIDMFKML